MTMQKTTAEDRAKIKARAEALDFHYSELNVLVKLYPDLTWDQRLMIMEKCSTLSLWKDVRYTEKETGEARTDKFRTTCTPTGKAIFELLIFKGVPQVIETIYGQRFIASSHQLHSKQFYYSEDDKHEEKHKSGTILTGYKWVECHIFLVAPGTQIIIGPFSSGRCYFDEKMPQSPKLTPAWRSHTRTMQENGAEKKAYRSSPALTGHGYRDDDIPQQEQDFAADAQESTADEQDFSNNGDTATPVVEEPPAVEREEEDDWNEEGTEEEPTAPTAPPVPTTPSRRAPRSSPPPLGRKAAPVAKTAKKATKAPKPATAPVVAAAPLPDPPAMGGRSDE